MNIPPPDSADRYTFLPIALINPIQIFFFPDSIPEKNVWIFEQSLLRQKKVKKVKMSNCQNVKMSKCQKVKMSKCQNVKKSKCQKVKKSKCQKVKMSKCQNVKMSKSQKVKMSKSQNVRNVIFFNRNLRSSLSSILDPFVVFRISVFCTTILCILTVTFLSRIIFILLVSAIIPEHNLTRFYFLPPP